MHPCYVAGRTRRQLLGCASGLMVALAPAQSALAFGTGFPGYGEGIRRVPFISGHEAFYSLGLPQILRVLRSCCY